MLNKLHDLLFVIGLFLTVIGSVVLLFGPSDVVHTVRVNLMGGSAFAIVGIGMILGSIFRKQEN